jgi:hypothetical protein
LLKRPKHPSLSAVVSDLRQKLVELAMSEAAQYGEAKSKSVIGKAIMEKTRIKKKGGKTLRKWNCNCQYRNIHWQVSK